MFRTPYKGIYLLDRSLQLKYIGASVEDYNNDPVTSAVLVKNQNQVRFTLASGVALYYDYYVDDWYVATNIAATGAVIWNNAYTYLKSNGVSYCESTSEYSDDGTAVNLSLKTGWVSMAGMQGYQRIWNILLLGEYGAPHTLTVNIYYDFSTTIGQTVTIPVLTNPGLYQFRIHVLQQKCEAFQVEIIEAQDSGLQPTASMSLANIAIEVGMKKGLNKLPGAASYG